MMNGELPESSSVMPGSDIQQRAENSTIDGGIQGVVGNYNVQTQDNRQTTQIFNFFAEHSSLTQERSRNEKLLLRDVNREVNSRLMQSLHNAVFVHLPMEERSDQVDRPWLSEIKIGSKPTELLPATTTLLEVFTREDIDGKLLILGSPGSGKTTIMLDLAKELLEHAKSDPNCPIPVLMTLSSWKNDRQSMPHWFVGELKRKYGVSTRLGKELLENRQLLPLLDGLDEVEPERQERCVQQINQWLKSDARPIALTVCSRTEEYNTITKNLKLNGCIHLKSLTSQQIQHYLTQTAHADWWSALSQDKDLLELIQVPLWLSISVLSYSRLSLEKWKHLDTNDERLSYLLNSFIRQMLERDLPSQKKRSYSSQQTLSWLIWLAKQLEQRSQDEFLLEQMQPALLATKTQRWMYRIIIGAILGLLDGLLFGMVTTPAVGMLVGVIIGLIVAIADKPVSTYRATDISTIETFQIVLSGKVIQEVFIHLKQNLIISSVIGLIVGLIFGSFKGLQVGLRIGLGGGLIFGLIGGFVFGLIGGLRADIQTRTSPNQGIWASVRNMPILILLVYPAGFLLDVSFFLIAGTSVHWEMSVLRGFVWAVVFALGTSGKACLQHLVLRMLLYLNGSIPWNYARFLDTCMQRSLLQRVGGSYRFVHRLLREHLTTINPQRFL